MIIIREFGDISRSPNVEIKTEQFVWRDDLRLAFFRVHPSGRELVCVCRTGYRAGQKPPKR